MQKRILTIAFSVLTFGQVIAQKPEKAVKKLGANPVFMLDSTQVNQSALNGIDPNTIAIVNMFYDKEAVDLLGEKAKDGAVYMETKGFARSRFIRFFRSYSASYDSLIAKIGSDKDFQYILNDKIQEENYEGNLALVDNDNILGLEVIDATQLKNKYNITNKLVGIAVKSKRPKDLYHGKKKF
ncbi:hypothetical protein QNI19_03105 [Cytophagaceae bacterium DM2B3-1]|uniref:DUF4252 domain-containing protein n=1 Tax=Xanthocytophaga flava TaxID=3048013 RepID=A0ABT7CDZ1_9BACT|nr:hypothetical protein [Xanthocytophaga flavus]MDJ1472724.1 hypothetical protein [Xanthocytophaga flavus]MDJ1491905.1 hypothetical protein [Xanthocytophaga flavus]